MTDFRKPPVDSPAAEDFDSTMVDALEEMAGEHPGYRRIHARGLLLDARFVPTGHAAASTVAPHLQGSEVPAVVRFSHVSGDPTAADSMPTVRGMAVRFLSPGQPESNLVSVNMPVFVASTPPKFLELTRRLTAAPLPGPERQAQVTSFITAHPESLRAFEFAAALSIPESYATTQYWANHAFVWVGPTGGRRHVRYRWDPVAGVQSATPEEIASWSPTHLTNEFYRRMRRGAISFVLRVQFAAADDPLEDSTQLWPSDREEIEVGTLEISRPSHRAGAWDAVTFDPLRVGQGIEPSNDPVLLARSAVYAISQHRRAREALNAFVPDSL
ncbi:catalase [Kribbella sp. NPDC051587]|uniref:catalase n=1 Tax=Kribbella sp. NPDC051587 TaxID=3364119 RepID=UPI0037A855A3